MCRIREQEVQDESRRGPDSQAASDVVVESSAEDSLTSQDSPGIPPLEPADAGDTPAGALEGTPAFTAEEEELLLDSADTAPGQSPESEKASVTGHMASMQVDVPPQEVPEEGDTSV